MESADSAIQEAEQHLHRGEPLLAYNAAQSGLQQWPGHPRLGQLQALALARSGDVEKANRILGELAAQGLDDAETLGLLARTHKDLALRSAGAQRRESHLRTGFDLYRRAFESARHRRADADALYAGINAATMAVLLGEPGLGREIAREVAAICRRVEFGAGQADARYWKEATLGEASLILGDAEAAGRHYGRAVAMAGRRYGDIGTTRRQARLLAAHLPGDSGSFDAILAIPPVVAFTGSMIDQPDRTSARFPVALEAAVRAAVRDRLSSLAPVAMYGSAACGADLLCLEIAREMGAETHLILPFPPAEFRVASVDFAGGDWGERFERALAAADSVTIASDHRASGSAATFEYANLILTGMGRLRAQVLDTALQGIAVWDPGAAGARGGAASLVSLWREQGVAIESILLPGLRTARPDSLPTEAIATAVDPVSGDARHELRALLFADAVGYSRLSEDQIPRYVSGFLGAVAELNRRTAHRFEHVETAGDGLYMVFGNTGDAGHYALELSALMRDFDRDACGLPPDFDLRIALHCGPVHCGRDPITGLAQYTGPHTSRAARIEPITPPGQVYASSAFAAVAAASGVDGLAMSYVGRIPLAKGHGTLGLYCVHPVTA